MGSRWFVFLQRKKISCRKRQVVKIFDYLPKTATEALEPAVDSPIVTTGKAEITDFKKLSNKWSFNTDVAEKSQIEVPVYDSPLVPFILVGKRGAMATKSWIQRHPEDAKYFKNQ